MPITKALTSRKAASPLNSTQSDPKTTDTMEVDMTTNRIKKPTKLAPAPSMKDVLKTPKKWRNAQNQQITVETMNARLATPSEGHLTGGIGQTLKAEAKKAEDSVAKAVAALVLGLFDAATFAHLMHLMTKSFAQHLAMEELYHGLIRTTDSFAEAYQGIYGVVPTYPLDARVPFAMGILWPWRRTLRSGSPVRRRTPPKTLSCRTCWTRFPP